MIHCPRFSRKKLPSIWLLCPSDSSILFFGYLPFFQSQDILGSSCTFPSTSPRISYFSLQGALVPCNGEWYLEIQIESQYILIATGVTLILDSLDRWLYMKCTYISYIHIYLHTYIILYLYLELHKTVSFHWCLYSSPVPWDLFSPSAFPYLYHASLTMRNLSPVTCLICNPVCSQFPDSWTSSLNLVPPYMWPHGLTCFWSPWLHFISSVSLLSRSSKICQPTRTFFSLCWEQCNSELWS